MINYFHNFNNFPVINLPYGEEKQFDLRSSGNIKNPEYFKSIN